MNSLTLILPHFEVLMLCFLKNVLHEQSQSYTRLAQPRIAEKPRNYAGCPKTVKICTKVDKIGKNDSHCHGRAPRLLVLRGNWMHWIQISSDLQPEVEIWQILRTCNKNLAKNGVIHIVIAKDSFCRRQISD